MVIPRLVRQAVAGQPLTVHGDGRQTRCFCHVADVVVALLRLIDDPRTYGEVFNVGSQEEICIKDLAERVIGCTGGGSAIRLVPYEQAYSAGFEDMQRRVPDITKVKGLIGWHPTRTLDNILAETVAEAMAEQPGLYARPS